MLLLRTMWSCILMDANTSSHPSMSFYMAKCTSLAAKLHPVARRCAVYVSCPWPFINSRNLANEQKHSIPLLVWELAPKVVDIYTDIFSWLPSIWFSTAAAVCTVAIVGVHSNCMFLHTSFMCGNEQLVLFRDQTAKAIHSLLYQLTYHQRKHEIDHPLI